jgi:hypothetical protein
MWNTSGNLTPNPFPSGKGNRTRGRGAVYKRSFLAEAVVE